MHHLTQKTGRSLSRTVWIILVILIIVVGVVLWDNERHITNMPPSGDRIVAVGDSLVAGAGNGTGGGFVEDLETRFNTEIRNFGVSGYTSRDVLQRIDEVVAAEPDIVLLLIGGNDYLTNVSKETTRQNIAQIIQRLQKEGAVVILLGVRGGILSDNFASMYEDLAGTYGTYYVPDVLSGLLGDSEFMTDRIHPNSKGYEKIADRIEPILREVIQATSTR